jgi:hypothetical protein
MGWFRGREWSRQPLVGNILRRSTAAWGKVLRKTPSGCPYILRTDSLERFEAAFVASHSNSRAILES